MSDDQPERQLTPVAEMLRLGERALRVVAEVRGHSKAVRMVVESAEAKVDAEIAAAVDDDEPTVSLPTVSVGGSSVGGGVGQRGAADASMLCPAFLDL